MTEFHQIIFYILFTCCAIISIVGDFAIYKGIANGKLIKSIKENGQDIGTANDMLNQALGEKAARWIQAIEAMIPSLLSLILVAGLYFQGRYFENAGLSHTLMAYLLVQILDGIFVNVKWPTPMFPERPITKMLLITTGIFSLLGYILLIFIFIQAI